MGKEVGADLKKFMGKRVSVKLNAGRVVTGKLTGSDVFMNLTLEEAVEELPPATKVEIGVMVIRGNSVVELEGLEIV